MPRKNPPTNDPTFRRYCRTRFAALGKTLKSSSVDAGVTFQRIHQWIGLYPHLSPESVEALAKILEVSPATLARNCGA